MLESVAEQNPIFDNDSLEAKMSAAGPVVKQAFSELLKENDRLQKLRVKDEIRHKSEKHYLSAKITELESKPLKITIERTHDDSHKG